MKQVGKVAACIAVLLALLGISRTEAQEIVIEEGKHAEVGDFQCHPCFESLGTNALALSSQSGNNPVEMTAGELWKYFQTAT